MGDGARNEGGAFPFEPLDQGLFFGHQGVDLAGLAVEEVGNGGLFGGWGNRYS